MPGPRFARQDRACGPPGARTPRPAISPPGTAMCLVAAADNVAAGRDLLHTHFTTDQFGWRHGTSPWAPAIASRQVNGALVGEIGSYAGHLAAGALQLAAAGSAERLPAQAQGRPAPRPRAPTELAAGPASAATGNQPPRGIRGRRRPPRLDQAGRLGRRRRSHHHPSRRAIPRRCLNSGPLLPIRHNDLSAAACEAAFGYQITKQKAGVCASPCRAPVTERDDPRWGKGLAAPRRCGYWRQLLPFLAAGARQRSAGCATGS